MKRRRERVTVALPSLLAGPQAEKCTRRARHECARATRRPAEKFACEAIGVDVAVGAFNVYTDALAGAQPDADADERYVIGVRDVEVRRLRRRDLGTAAMAATERHCRWVDAKRVTEKLPQRSATDDPAPPQQIGAETGSALMLCRGEPAREDGYFSGIAVESAEPEVDRPIFQRQQLQT